VMNQGDMFQSDTSQLAARLFFKDEAMTRPESRPKIAENLETYAREAQKNTVGDRLFADDVAPKDVLRGTVERGADIPTVRLNKKGEYTPPDWAELGDGFAKREYYLDRTAVGREMERVQEIREPGGGEMTRFLGEDGREIGHQVSGEGDPFDRRNPGNPAQVEKRIREFLAGQRGADQNVLQLFHDAQSPETVERALTDPKVQDAAHAELQRMMERGDNQFVKPDGTKGVIDDEMHEIDQSLAAAKEVAACTNYSVAAE
jgi:hypothetical protein